MEKSTKKWLRIGGESLALAIIPPLAAGATPASVVALEGSLPAVLYGTGILIAAGARVLEGRKVSVMEAVGEGALGTWAGNVLGTIASTLAPTSTYAKPIARFIGNAAALAGIGYFEKDAA